MKMKFLWTKIACAAVVAVAAVSFSACDDVGDVENFEFKLIEKSVAYSDTVNNLIGTYMVTAYTGEDTSVTVPSKYEGVEVTVIGENAFKGRTDLETVNIPEGIVAINSYAFSECESLDDVTIPDSVTEYGEGIFSKCYSLSNVTLSANGKTINTVMFSHCSSLETITIPEGVKQIGIMAFLESGLKTVDLPESLTIIRSAAFGGCVSLESITIPDYTMKIDSSLCEGCTSLSTITIGAWVSEISESAFSGCGNITKITVSADNKNYKAKDGSLYSIDRTTLVKYATGKKDTAFTVPGGVTSIMGNAFENAQFLEAVEFDAELTEIGENAFKGCTALKEATVGVNVTKIGTSAFSGCPIEKIYYLGTARQFSSIKIGESNEAFLAAIEYNV